MQFFQIWCKSNIKLDEGTEQWDGVMIEKLENAAGSYSGSVSRVVWYTREQVLLVHILRCWGLDDVAPEDVKKESESLCSLSILKKHLRLSRNNKAVLVRWCDLKFLQQITIFWHDDDMGMTWGWHGDATLQGSFCGNWIGLISNSPNPHTMYMKTKMEKWLHVCDATCLHI